MDTRFYELCSKEFDIIKLNNINKVTYNVIKREGRTPVWNSEWHWPVKSGKKKEKEEKGINWKWNMKSEIMVGVYKIPSRD